MGMYVPSIAENCWIATGRATVCKRADSRRSSRVGYAESENAHRARGPHTRTAGRSAVPGAGGAGRLRE
ncbi:hypothetical protein GCM10010515_43720 [Streptomyces fructofermentans]|uniref:Uncharacterized protein n=1 Tax=Streptomyces fructofermentans TaxID=152141 RepID=A0A918KS85_9ACTN|nr:hypothetical protein GCM10010515_43720 [Streptomyces fructofermentans]